ncbi:hypothetical protein VCV18_001389 [Metarhizium anisopliae]
MEAAVGKEKITDEEGIQPAISSEEQSGFTLLRVLSGPILNFIRHRINGQKIWNDSAKPLEAVEELTLNRTAPKEERQ